jgi:alcohol dehydrogenase YqhD (iron-dependent ADH family)
MTHFARFGAFDAIAHGFEHFVKRASAREIQTGAAAGIVQVVVGKARDHRHPVQIDDASVRQPPARAPSRWYQPQ